MDICRIHKLILCGTVGQSCPIILLLLLVFFIAVPSAHAQIADPFAVTATSEWVSLDQYEKLGPKKSSDEAQGQGDALTGSLPPNEELEPAQPARPLNLPVMPGLSKNKEYTVASSDEPWDDYVASNKPWLKIDEEHDEYKKQETAAKLTNNKTKSAYNIRLPFLPGNQIQSISAPRVSMAKLEREAKAEHSKKQISTEAQLVQTKEKTEACEALSEYRLRQLKAMESDRKTLAQLKSVMSDLGVSKELGFITNGSGSLTLPSQQEASSGKRAHDTTSGPETKTP